MSTDIVYTRDFFKNIKGETLLIDTCVIIEASKNVEFATFLRELRKKGCTLVSVLPVRNEFLACAQNQPEYEALEEFLATLDIVFLSSNIEKRLEIEGELFSIAMRRSKVKNPSYVDRLLLAIPYLYESSPEQIFVLTLNHKDVPSEFYKRPGFVVWDRGDNFAEVGLYKFDKNSFDKATQKT